jgi:hypothetical protein
VAYLSYEKRKSLIRKPQARSDRLQSTLLRINQFQYVQKLFLITRNIKILASGCYLRRIRDGILDKVSVHVILSLTLDFSVVMA